jgi:predicted permease
MERIPMWRRYMRLLGPDPAADARDEVRFHIEAKADELVSQGWPRQAAEREAERQFGDVRAIEAAGERLGRERTRSVDRKDFFDSCAQDMRYALRTLAKERGFTTVTVLILALGIAANTAVFSVVNTVLLRPLPFPRSEQLIWMTSGKRSAAQGRVSSGLSNVTYTVAAFEEYQRQNRSFQQVASYDPFFGDSDFTMTGRGEPQPVAGVAVSESFFGTLGVRAALGRVFTKEECQRGGPAAILLSHAFWQRRLGGDPGVVGRAVTLRQRSVSVVVTVVGVLPETFDFGAVFAPGSRFDVFVPAVMDDLRNSGNTLALVGRLNPGVTVGQAQAEADGVWAQIHASHKEWWGDYTSVLTGLKEQVSGKLRRALMLLWSAVGLMLLIVCVNLSSLMLARGAARAKEFAVRSALGAGRGRLVRQLLTEGAILASAGAALGLGLAYALVFYLARQGSIALPLLTQVRVDGVALLWTFGLTAAVAVLFGVVPGISVPTGSLQNSLKDGGRGTTSGRRHERLRSALVVSEVALASVLLVGAGLLLRSFLNVLDVDLGFQPARAAAIQVDYDDANNNDRRGAVLREMVRAVESIPGVEVAGVADMLPLGRNRSWGIRAKGRTYAREVDRNAVVRVVTPGYLAAMGIRLTAGRDLAWSDTSKNERVVILNQAAVRRFWEGDDALGRLASMGGGDVRVVGIVADVRAHSLEAAAGPEMYVPAMQTFPEGGELVLRSTLPPETLAPSVMKVLRGLNPAQPAAALRPLQEIVDRSVSPRRFFVGLVASFAALGLLLASLGVYGVISYSVARQRQEIGVRMALGASAAQVRAGVIVRAMRMALAGILAGSLASLAVASWIESLLYATRPFDPPTFVGLFLILGAVAFVAGYIPARRASLVDPMEALRSGE